MLMSLFLVFAKIGLFSVGGGYAAVPFIESQAVAGCGWLTMEEFAHLLTIAEMTPGPIAVNAATFVGIRLCGIPGAVTATLGVITPALVLVTLLGFMYRKYRGLKSVQTVLSTMRPAVCAMVASAFLNLFLSSAFPVPGTDIPAIALFAAAILFLRLRRGSPILTMVSCGAAYMLFHLIFG